MEPLRSTDVLGVIRAHARPLPADAVDEELLRALSARRIVLLGEASHGTRFAPASRRRWSSGMAAVPS
jgi:erythromycin esterase-like protein